MQPERFDYLVAMARMPDTNASRAPDVAAAEAAEVAILEQIAAKAPAKMREVLLPALQRPNTVISSTGNPQVSELITQYYEARAHRVVERQRQVSVERAQHRKSISVVVALGDPKNGDVAALFRRRLINPPNLIVLSRKAGAEALAGALDALNHSRTLYGDQLLADQHVGVREVRAWNANPTQIARLQSLIDRLGAASERDIEGLGVAKAIDMQSEPLTLKGNLPNK